MKLQLVAIPVAINSPLQPLRTTLMHEFFLHNKHGQRSLVPEATPGSDFDYAQEEPVVILSAVLLPNLSPACASATALCLSHDPIQRFLCGRQIYRQHCTNCVQGLICHDLCAQLLVRFPALFLGFFFQALHRFQVGFLHRRQRLRLEFAIFRLGLFQRLLMAHVPRIMQQLPPAGGKHSVQLRDIIPHVHGSVLDGRDFGQVEVTGNQIVQHLQFLLIQIILGHAHVPQHRQVAGERAQAHEGLLGVGALINHFRCRVTVGGEMQLVLHDLEEANGILAVRIIVHAVGVQIQHLPVQHLFRRTNVPDSIQQLFPVAAPAVALQPFVVQRKAFLHVFLQARRGPLAEMHTNLRPDSVTDGDDHVQVIMNNVARNLTATFILNCSEFPNSFFFRQFAVLKNMFNMLADIGFTAVIQFD